MATLTASLDRGGRRDRASARTAACALAALAGIALTIVTYAPGAMDGDAVIQLEQARRGVYSDSIPPLMSWVWSWLDRVVAGPLGMLLLHNVLFWSGLGLVIGRLRVAPLWCAITILAIGLFPPISSALGTIWKDVGMAAALVLAFAVFGRARRDPAWIVLPAGLLLLLYALSVRHNAVFAVFPLALWAGVLGSEVLLPGRRRRALASLVLGCVVFVGLVVLSRGMSRALVGQHRDHSYQQIPAHDLLAISVHRGASVLPPAVVSGDQPLTVEALRCLYSADQIVMQYDGRRGTCSHRLKHVHAAKDLRALLHSWIRTVPSNLGAYLSHRWAVFRGQFAIGRDRVCYPIQVGIAPNSIGLEFHPSRWYEIALRLASDTAYRTPLFKGWVYLALLAVTLPLVLWRGGAERLPLLALWASAALYALAYLVVSVGCFYRYHWWTVVASVLLLVVVLGTDRASSLVGEGQRPARSALEIRSTS